MERQSIRLLVDHAFGGVLRGRLYDTFESSGQTRLLIPVIPLIAAAAAVGLRLAVGRIGRARERQRVIAA